MKKRISIVPAILTDSPESLETMVRQAETFTDYAQIDIMDSQFVPSRSITWQDLAGLSIKLDWEAHLMVLHPEEQFAGFKKAGAKKVIFHFEATDSPESVITEAKRLNLKVDIALKPETPVSAIRPVVNRVDGILFLSVNPGFYGSKFQPKVLAKVDDLRQSHPGTLIGIDGGIKENNIREVARSGVDIIFVGSAIFLAADPGDSYKKLVDLANLE